MDWFCLQNTTFNLYNPSNSTSSTQLTCASVYCDLAASCPSSSSQCPYHLQYLSPVSTDGYLVADMLYLVPQKGGNKTNAQVVFGYGKNNYVHLLDFSTYLNEEHFFYSLAIEQYSIRS